MASIPAKFETQMHCFKRPGERVMARTFERQGVELLPKFDSSEPFFVISARSLRCKSTAYADF